MPRILNEKPSISIEIPSISIENLGFRSKYKVFRIRNFEILGFSHPELEIIGISCEIPGISETWSFVEITNTKKIILSHSYFCLFQIFGP